MPTLENLQSMSTLVPPPAGWSLRDLSEKDTGGVDKASPIAQEKCASLIESLDYNWLHTNIVNQELINKVLVEVVDAPEIREALAGIDQDPSGFEEVKDLVVTGKTDQSSLMKIAMWLAQIVGREKELEYLKRTKFEVTRTTAKWAAKAFFLVTVYKAARCLMMWILPGMNIRFNVPILSTLQMFMPAKAQKVLSQIGVPLVKLIEATVTGSNKTGVMLARIHQRYGGWKSCWSLNFLSHCSSVKLANRYHPRNVWYQPLVAFLIYQWVKSWKADLVVRITSKSLPAYTKLLHHLRSWSLFTSRTPETLQSIKSSANAWMAKNPEELKGLSEAERSSVMLAAITNAMIPDSQEASAVDAMTGQGKRLRKMFNVNKRGWAHPIDWITGKRMPKR